jgi:hypothetical protein
MRSNLIHGAVGTMSNRFLLCQVVSKATRKFHRPSVRIQETMNDILTRVGKAEEAEQVMAHPSEKVAQSQRRAA